MMSYVCTEPLLFLEHIYLAYKQEILFDDFSLSLPSGKWICLLGKSGVGKTTLLKLIAGLIPSHAAGEIFQGKIHSSLSPLHQHITYMAQTDLLLPWFSVLDNVLLGTRLRGDFSSVVRKKAEQLLKDVGLSGAEKKFPKHLSGGMRQRAALVRTLLEDKPIVLMDEPFSSVDALTRFQLQTLASHLLKNRTVVLVTHDPLEALHLADDIYILHDQPAKLKQIAKFKQSGPRDVSDLEFIHYQPILFRELLGH